MANFTRGNRREDRKSVRIVWSCRSSYDLQQYWSIRKHNISNSEGKISKPQRFYTSEATEVLFLPASNIHPRNSCQSIPNPSVQHMVGMAVPFLHGGNSCPSGRGEVYITLKMHRRLQKHQELCSIKIKQINNLCR